MGYENLSETVERLIDAAIDSHMFNKGWIGDVTNGYDGAWNVGWHIPPPGNPRSTPVQVTRNGEPVEFSDGVDPARDIYGLFEGLIRGAFDGWGQLPDPEAFDSLAKAAGDAAWYVGINPGSERPAPNPEISKVAYLNKTLHEMRGEMVRTFLQNYSEPLAGVIAGHYSIAVMADFVLEAKAEIWRRTRADIAQIAENGVLAMRASRYGAEGGDLKGLLTTVGALASIVGVFASGGAAAPIIVAIGTIASSVGTLLPDPVPPKVPEISLKAESASLCWGNILDAIGALREKVHLADDELGKVVANVVAHIDEYPSSYDLARPALIDATDPEAVTHDVLEVDLSMLRDLGVVTLPGIATQLTEAANKAAEAEARDAWWVPANTGLNNAEPMVSLAMVLQRFRKLTDNTAWELREAGQVLEIVTRNLAATDAEEAAALLAHAKAVAAHP